MNNAGKGVYINSSYPVSIENSTIGYNLNDGVNIVSSTASIDNSFVVGNFPDPQAGIDIYCSSVEINNSVIINHTGNFLNSVGGIFNYDSMIICGVFYVVINNSIVRDNYLDNFGELGDWGNPYVNYSNINGNAGAIVIGSNNIDLDPEFIHVPLSAGYAYDGGTDWVTIYDGAGSYNVGDVIEINGDGVARVITATGSQQYFDPPLAYPFVIGMAVENWGPGETDLDYDLHLQPSSPCIDAGDPDPAYNDPDGSRNDMGVYGGPGAEPR